MQAHRVATDGRSSRTLLRRGGFRFHLVCCDDTQPHVHASCADGDAEFEFEPRVALARNHGLSALQLRSAEALIRAHEHTIRAAWQARLRR